MADEVKDVVEETISEDPIEVTPEIIPDKTTSNPLTDGLQMAAYSAGVMLATTVMVNAGGQLLNAAGRGISKGAKWIGGKLKESSENRKQKKLLKSESKEAEETESED